MRGEDRCAAVLCVLNARDRTTDGRRCIACNCWAHNACLPAEEKTKPLDGWSCTTCGIATGARSSQLRSATTAPGVLGAPVRVPVLSAAQPLQQQQQQQRQQQQLNPLNSAFAAAVGRGTSAGGLLRSGPPSPPGPLLQGIGGGRGRGVGSALFGSAVAAAAMAAAAAATAAGATGSLAATTAGIPAPPSTASAVSQQNQPATAVASMPVLPSAAAAVSRQNQPAAASIRRAAVVTTRSIAAAASSSTKKTPAAVLHNQAVSRELQQAVKSVSSQEKAVLMVRLPTIALMC
jgi:hypothetical protein